MNQFSSALRFMEKHSDLHMGLHNAEIQSLLAVTNPNQIAENEVAKTFKENKVDIPVMRFCIS